MATLRDGSGPEAPPVARSGIPGLDAILGGGLPREEMHLMQGVAGTGKTTAALQFLREGVRDGEPTLYLTLSQSRPHLERIARSHGWSVDGIVIHELSPGTVADRIANRQTVLATADVELEELFHDVTELVDQVRPRRAVIDSITIFQLLAGSPPRYHRDVVTVRQLFVERGCTLLALADHPAEIEEGDPPEVIFHPLCGCVIHLKQNAHPYGDARRQLRVVKARGMAHNGGYHDLKIRTGSGMVVYPRLGAYRQVERGEHRQIASGVEMLDHLFGGGLERGSSCLLVGPSGTGKSSIASLYALALARAGDHSSIFLFDERPETFLVRSELNGTPLREHVSSGRILLEQVDPGEIAPGEFSQRVRSLVEDKQTRLVVIDSVIGYFAAMGTADVLVTQLHELLTYVTRNDVLMVMCGSQEGFMSIGLQQAVDVSYLSDTIAALTFYEDEAELHRAIAVVKKKHSSHPSTIHEIVVGPAGVSITPAPLAGHRSLMVSRRRSTDDD